MLHYEEILKDLYMLMANRRICNMQLGEHFPQKIVKHRRLTNHSNSDKPGATCSVEFIHSKLLQLKYLLEYIWDIFVIGRLGLYPEFRTLPYRRRLAPFKSCTPIYTGLGLNAIQSSITPILLFYNTC